MNGGAGASPADFYNDVRMNVLAKIFKSKFCPFKTSSVS